MKNLSKLPARIGALILVVVSGFHMTGLEGARAAAAEITNSFMKMGLEPVWTMPSVHWLVFAIIAWVLTLRPSHHSRVIMLLIAAAVIIDALLIGMRIGPFIGAILLGVAGVLIAWSAWIMPRQS